MNKNKVPLWAPALVMVAAVLLLTVSTGGADADKGRHGGSITVPDGVFGGSVTATVNPGGTDTWARAFCYQNGQLVYGQYERVNADNQATFTLGPTPSWQSGDASCVAEELTKKSNGLWRVLASTTFNAQG